MSKVCPRGCIHEEECSYAFGDGPWPEDCELMEDEEEPFKACTCQSGINGPGPECPACRAACDAAHARNYGPSHLRDRPVTEGER